VLRGVVAPAIIEEHGIQYKVDLLEGQKTGFFLDQRENRATIARYSNGASVLDCFCNDGGFALNAARGGAAAVLGIDASADAVGRARANALHNRLERVEFEENDVFERLKELQSGNMRFDVIVLDPPSFTKSRKNVQTAKKGYREIHERAIQLLHKGGTLLTASCSHHIEPEVFLSLVEDAAQRTGRNVQLLDWRGAAPDHPTLPAVPETRYLKFGIFRVL
jgi:23S rRNA (cytosine1962-C5)-methyltransferase